MSKLVKTMAEIQAEAYEIAISKGHWNGWKGLRRHIGDIPVGILMFNSQLHLINTEVSEAGEAVRSRWDEEWYRAGDGKPEGCRFELADIVLRVANISGALGFDLQAAVAEKMEFNRTRPYKHGRIY